MDAPVTREERYCFHRRGMRPADRPSPALSNAGLGGNGGLGERGDALLDLGGDLRAGGQAGLQDVLDLDAEVLDLRPGQAGLRGRVLGDRTDLTPDAVAALAQLTLDARAGALDLALQRTAGGLAATLGLAQLGLELALGLGARAVLRAQLVDGVDEGVTREQGGADVRQRGALGDGLDRQLGRARLAGGGALGARGARLGGGGGALAGAGAALGSTRLSSLLRSGRTLGGGRRATGARLAGVRAALRLGLAGAGVVGHWVPPSGGSLSSLELISVVQQGYHRTYVRKRWSLHPRKSP